MSPSSSGSRGGCAPPSAPLDGTVADAGGRTLESGGKRLRPLLVHLSAPPATRDRESLVIAGCAVELVHMATLVHDDQLDRAPLRRGRPTVWATDGERVATSTGDYLFARAFAELVETGDLPAVTLLSDACLSLARGEILQRAQAGAVDTTVEQYLERCRLKTGRLFAAAAMLGGRLGGLGDADLAALAPLRRVARPGLPDRRRRARLRRRPADDRQAAGHRPARRHGHAAADPGRRARPEGRAR